MDKYEKLHEEEFKGNDYYEKKYKDPIAMKELELCVRNDERLFKPFINNIKRKIKSNKYDHKLAPKLWMYLLDSGAKKYGKESLASPSDWPKIFVKSDRIVLAQKLADYYYDSILSGAY